MVSSAECSTNVVIGFAFFVWHFPAFEPETWPDFARVIGG